MTTQSNPVFCSWAGTDTTKAGRRCLTGRSVYGNGTDTTSNRSKVAIALTVGFGCPFGEAREWVVTFGWHPDDPDLATIDDKSKTVTCLETKGFPGLLGQDDLGLRSQAGPSDGNSHPHTSYVIP
jgi:hypothetical protein